MTRQQIFVSSVQKELAPPLTLESLRKPHASIPHSPLIAEPMFLAAYAEKAGSGILDMIGLCRETGIRLPQFRQDGGQFIQILWRPSAAIPGKTRPSVRRNPKGEGQ